MALQVSCEDDYILTSLVYLLETPKHRLLETPTYPILSLESLSLEHLSYYPLVALVCLVLDNCWMERYDNTTAGVDTKI